MYGDKEVITIESVDGSGKGAALIAAAVRSGIKDEI
jgi:hypothetical protein